MACPTRPSAHLLRADRDWPCRLRPRRTRCWCRLLLVVVTASRRGERRQTERECCDQYQHTRSSYEWFLSVVTVALRRGIIGSLRDALSTPSASAPLRCNPSSPNSLQPALQYPAPRRRARRRRGCTRAFARQSRREQRPGPGIATAPGSPRARAGRRRAGGRRHHQAAARASLARTRHSPALPSGWARGEPR